MSEVVRVVKGEVIVNDGWNTDRVVQVSITTLKTEQVIIESDENDIVLDITLGPGVLSELRRSK